MTNLHFPNKKIEKFYPYRTALVCGFKIEDDSEHNVWHRVCRFVEKRNGYHMDNHICFKTEDGLCFMWSDRSLTIGLTLVERNW